MATDVTALRGLRDRLAAVSQPPFRTRLSQLCAAAALKLVADEFRGSHDPYGTAWQPLASRRGKPLLDTGRLRASFSVQPTSDGFRIGTRVSYAGFHQFGTRSHARAARTARQDARGRFARKGARSAYLLKIRAHTHSGIPARPMLPTDAGGVPARWTQVFQREIADATRRQIQGTA